MIVLIASFHCTVHCYSSYCMLSVVKIYILVLHETLLRRKPNMLSDHFKGWQRGLNTQLLDEI